MGRRPCCDKSKVKRGSWSPDEDATLKNYLHKHGTAGNWIALPQKAGLKRCGKSCRLRWLNYLRPDIKHGAFTQEEETIICNLYFKIGSRWSVIASHLPGRTDNDVKNYWNTKMKKKLAAATAGAVVAGGGATTVLDNSVPLAPTFQEQYVPDNNPSFNFPTFDIEGQNGNCSSEFVEESSPFRQTLMDQNYGVKEAPPMDEYSYEVLSGFWSQDEGMGFADGNEDLFSIFRGDSKPQGVSQSH